MSHSPKEQMDNNSWKCQKHHYGLDDLILVKCILIFSIPGHLFFVFVFPTQSF